MITVPSRFLSGRHLLLSLLLALQATVGCAANTQDVKLEADSEQVDSDYQRAAEYSRRNAGDALIIMRNENILVEDYAQGASPEKPHRLASGTKTFWGLLAVAAAQDGFLDLDETVADTLTEWRGDPRKSRITVRQLLNFTSGLDPAVERLRGNPRAGDKFRQAIEVRALADPGTSFAYGPSHLFAFGAWLERKLAAAGRDPDPLTYLHERILDRIGLNIGRWMRDAAGHPIMPSGAHVAPREWIKLGQLIVNDGNWKGRSIIEPRYLRQMFEGSSANPAYGLTVWLNQDAGDSQGFAVADGKNLQRLERSDDGFIYREGPKDLVMAAGQGKQRLYLIPSLNFAILRQGNSKGSGWVDREFLAMVLAKQHTSHQPDTAPLKDSAAPLNWRDACESDIQRICPDVEQHDRRALRRCYRRFHSEFSAECQQAVSELRRKRTAVDDVAL